MGIIDINTLKLTGLEEAANETDSLDYYNGGNFVRVCLNTETGRVFGDYHVGTGDETNYKEHIMPMFVTRHTMSAGVIKQLVVEWIEEHNYILQSV